MISVLYVDDEPALLDVCKKYLEKTEEFNVKVMTSAPKALDLLHISHFDLIISDYEMPMMNGLDFLKKVRSDFGDIPFILFTGRGREEIVIQALNEGVNYYLQKGGDIKSLFAELTHKIKLAVMHRKMADELCNSERRHREVVETQSDFICRFTSKGVIVFANKAYCSHFGKKREEIIGHRFIPDIPVEDKEKNNRHIHSLTQNNPVGEIEHRIQMSDNSIRWYIWRDQAIFNENGTLIEYQSLGKDITDRKIAEEALKRSESLYQTIFENSGPSILIYGDNRIIINANAEFELLTGYSREEIQGKRAWTDFVLEEDISRMEVYDLDRACNPANAPKTHDFKLITKEGDIRYCINHVSLIPGTSQRVASIIDITERVLAEQEYQNIFHNIQDIFYRTNAHQELILLSPSAGFILGYSSVSELYGKKIADALYFNPEEHKKFLMDIEETSSVSNYEIILKDKDGRPMTIIANSHKYYDSGGKFLGIEGIFRDISDRKKAEKALLRSESLYRAVFENTGTASIIIGPENTIIRANSGWEKLTGIPIKDQTSKLCWMRFVHIDDIERMKRFHNMRRIDPTLVPTEYETRILHVDGSIKNCIINVDIIPGTGDSVASLVDITERKQLEEKLRAVNKDLAGTQNTQDTILRTEEQLGKAKINEYN